MSSSAAPKRWFRLPSDGFWTPACPPKIHFDEFTERCRSGIMTAETPWAKLVGRAPAPHPGSDTEAGFLTRKFGRRGYNVGRGRTFLIASPEDEGGQRQGEGRPAGGDRPHEAAGIGTRHDTPTRAAAPRPGQRRRHQPPVPRSADRRRPDRRGGGLRAAHRGSGPPAVRGALQEAQVQRGGGRHRRSASIAPRVTGCSGRSRGTGTPYRLPAYFRGRHAGAVAGGPGRADARSRQAQPRAGPGQATGRRLPGGRLSVGVRITARHPSCRGGGLRQRAGGARAKRDRTGRGVNGQSASRAADLRPVGPGHHHGQQRNVATGETITGARPAHVSRRDPALGGDSAAP